VETSGTEYRGRFGMVLEQRREEVKESNLPSEITGHLKEVDICNENN
jgi:hypothetical protein